MATQTSNGKPFLTDVKTLRDRARKHMDQGAVTTAYQGDVSKTIEILQTVLATEIVCVLRYTMHAVTATGIHSEGVKADVNPEGLASRAASEYGKAQNLVDMIKENLVAERIAIEHYQELIRYFANEDPGTRAMLEGILVVEEEHANDMSDLLVAHEGQPMTSN